VSLGWQRLLERPLGDGRLVRLGDVTVRPDGAHHLVVRETAAERPAVKAFTAWIAENFESEP
jgi:DNA-binding transcriptional LysR family regulator